MTLPGPEPATPYPPPGRDPGRVPYDPTQPGPAPIEEPDPERMPDEDPDPNPDEGDDPPVVVSLLPLWEKVARRAG